MRVLTLVGNRPQFVKAAAVSRVLRERHEEVLVHSGQHYDDELSAVFFRELGVPAPDHELRVGSAPDGEQIGRIMHAVRAGRGRTRSPTSCSSTGTRTRRLPERCRARACALPLAHVEAGMRSFDRSMPEERNRVLTDHLSDLLLCSTEVAVTNLEREGIDRGRRAGRRRDGRRRAGDGAGRARRRPTCVERLGLRAGRLPARDGAPGRQRGRPGGAGRLVEILQALPLPAVFPVHPRTRERLADAGALERLEQRTTR